jgi:uncharacterized membrane protein HdeD (DUF308 family)
MSGLQSGELRKQPSISAGWFIALGVVMVILGVIAWFDVIAVTIAGTVFIGAMLLIGGIVQIFHAFMDRQWRALLFHLLAGLLSAIAGFLIMAEPIQGSVAITIFLAIALILAGALRIAIAVQHRDMQGWGMLLLAGIVTVIVGILLYATLPWSGLWVLGTLIAVELIVQGIGWIRLGFVMRRDTPLRSGP